MLDKPMQPVRICQPAGTNVATAIAAARAKPAAIKTLRVGITLMRRSYLLPIFVRGQDATIQIDSQAIRTGSEFDTRGFQPRV